MQYPASKSFVWQLIILYPLSITVNSQAIIIISNRYIITSIIKINIYAVLNMDQILVKMPLLELSHSVLTTQWTKICFIKNIFILQKKYVLL